MNAVSNSGWEASDAELLAICEQAVAASNEHCVLSWRTGDMPSGNPDYARIVGDACDRFQAFVDLAERAAEIRANTAAGREAKTKVAITAISHDDLTNCKSIAQLLLLDVAGRMPGQDAFFAMLTPEHPDAAILELCATLEVKAMEWQRLYDATSEDPDECTPADEEYDAYSNGVWPGFDLQDEDNPDPERDPVGQLAIVPARTAEGRKARAAAIYAIDMAERYTEHQRQDLMDMMLLVVREAAGDAVMKIGEQG